MVTDQKKLREININSPPHEKNSSQQMYIYVDWLEAVNIFGRVTACRYNVHFLKYFPRKRNALKWNLTSLSYLPLLDGIYFVCVTCYYLPVFSFIHTSVSESSFTILRAWPKSLRRKTRVILAQRNWRMMSSWPWSYLSLCHTRMLEIHFLFHLLFV